jgi:two-component system chemotaxis response regulator CheB
MGGPIRVLVADDSPTVRAVLRRLILRNSDMTVVGEAGDGEAAVEAALRLAPDVVLMDIEMPVMDGFAATARIMALRPTPVVVVTSRANRDQVRTAFEAIRHGAVEVLAKPEQPEGWERMAEELPRIVRTAAGAHTVTGAGRQASAHASPTLVSAFPTGRPPDHRADIRFVAIGASTGGPQAIHELLGALPAAVPATVVIVQHIAAGFESGLADWLGRELGRDVAVACDGEIARPGSVRLAAAGGHLFVEPPGTLRIDRTGPPRGGHRPSVDTLFGSFVGALSAQTVAVLLSGMGADGAEGLLALRRAGALTMVQNEASSVVFGMPNAALQCGAASIALPPRELGEALASLWEVRK